MLWTNHAARLRSDLIEDFMMFKDGDFHSNIFFTPSVTDLNNHSLKLCLDVIQLDFRK